MRAVPRGVGQDSHGTGFLVKTFFIYRITSDREPRICTTAKGNDRWDALQAFLVECPEMVPMAEYLFACEFPIGVLTDDDVKDFKKANNIS